MLSKNMQLFLFSTTLLTAGVAHASPILYAWGGHSDGTAGGQTYAIDPVAATVIVVRGSGVSDGGSGFGGTSSSGAGGSSGTAGSSGSTGGAGNFSFSNFSNPGTGGTPSSSGLGLNLPGDCGSLERLQTLAGMLGISANLQLTGAPSPCAETLRSTLLELISPDGGTSTGELTASSVIFSADTFILADSDSAPVGLLPVTDDGSSTSSLLATPSAVPEPGVLGLLGLALAALGTRMRRRK